MQEEFGQKLLTQRTIKITRNPEETVICVLLKKLDEGWAPYPADEATWMDDTSMFIVVITTLLIYSIFCGKLLSKISEFNV